MPCNIFDWLAKLINSITTLTFPVTQKQRIYNLKISCFVCPLQQRTMNIIVFTAQCPLTQLYENTALASRHQIRQLWLKKTPRLQKGGKRQQD